jgi:hypothetical protein
MYRTAFDREIGAPPPSTVDVDGIIRRRRRFRRVRTALTVTAVGVTAVTLVGVTLTALPGNGTGGERAAAPGPTASDPPDVVAARLQAALRGFLDGRLPDAEYRGNRQQFGPLVFEHRHREAKAEVPGVSGGVDAEDYYFASADVVLGTGTGNIAVGVGRSDPDRFGITGTCPDEGPLDAKSYSCTPSTGAGGARFMIATTTGSRAVQFRAEAVRADGVAVFVAVTNNSRLGATAELEYDRADAPQPPLTADEAGQLALLPALTV